MGQENPEIPPQPAVQEIADRTRRPLGSIGKTLLCLYLLALPLLLGYLTIAFWPSAKPDSTHTLPDSTIHLFGTLFTFSVTGEIQLILLVMVLGALGGYVHNATSFVDYAGNRRLYSSWAWWYILRPFVSMALALLFYFVIRGGLLSQGAGAGDVSPFGIAAVAGLVGMFAKQATDKLEEMFNTMFKTDQTKRADALERPKPQIDRLDPPFVTVGSVNALLTITGSNFAPESVVTLNDVNQPARFVSATQLTVQVPVNFLVPGDDIHVTVFTPSPGGGTSNTVNLPVR